MLHPEIDLFEYFAYVSDHFELGFLFIIRNHSRYHSGLFVWGESSGPADALDDVYRALFIVAKDH